VQATSAGHRRHAILARASLVALDSIRFRWLGGPVGLCARYSLGTVGQRLVELPAGADVELGEDLAQVPFDRPCGQEELGGDLRVGQARPGQLGDLGLLGGELKRYQIVPGA
jgi:hypothetical protein